MNRLAHIVVLIVCLMPATRMAWASCDPGVKTQMAADIQAMEACSGGDEHCKVRQLMNELINKELYGKSGGYVQTFNYCLQVDADTCILPTGVTIDPAHAFVLISLATDTSYVAAQETPDLQTAFGIYQCANEMLGAVISPQNVVETSPKEIVVQAPADGNAEGNPVARDGGGVITGLECKSGIFDCSKPLAFYPLPIGQFCTVSRIEMGYQKQLLLIRGTEATILLDPKTFKAAACKDQVQAVACNPDDEIVAVGKNADGSSHMAIIDGHILVNPAGAFQKMLGAAKPLLEIISQPVTGLCEDIFKDAKADFEKNAFAVTSLETVTYKGIPEPVEMGPATLHGNRALVVLKSKTAQTYIGIGILTLGDSPEATKMEFKPFPDEVAIYKTAHDVAVSGGNSGKVTMNIATGTDVVVCNVVLSETTPLSCAIQKGDSVKNFKGMVGAKLKELSYAELGSETFGEQLGDTLLVDDAVELQKLLRTMMHGFEGFGQDPDALMMDPAGNRMYRRGADGKVFLDPNEILPGTTDGCFLVDIDTYGGKDLACFGGNVIYFLPKLNLPPKIDYLSLSPVADAQKVQAKAVTRTQEDEGLAYKWQVLEYKDGNLTERPDLIVDATTAQPTLNFSADSVATSVTPLAALSDQEKAASAAMAPGDMKADSNINTLLAKSVGMKAAADSAQPVYFMALTATDPGGMSASGYAAISKTAGGTSGIMGLPASTPEPAAPSPVSGPASLGFGIFGGCSLIR